jgi:NAD(P)-dependent dehydrogenase (short-subunit alcohol dehydrogenase family)
MPKALVKPGKPRSAVVTGAGRGIGRAIAIELMGKGYEVVVTDLDADAARLTASEIGAPLGLGLDVRDPLATRGVAEEARLLAPLGAWVCNAGVCFDGSLQDLSDDQIRTLLDVNVLGVAWGSRVATEVFRAQAKEKGGEKGGEIGIVASLSSHTPVPGLSMYAASKAAALSLATSLHVELKKDKIRVHAVCPDGVDTAMVAGMKEDGEAKELVRAGTFLQPAQVAHELVAMFGTRRVYKTLPVSRGVQARLAGLAPGPVMRMEPLLRRVGRRRLKKEHRPA